MPMTSPCHAESLIQGLVMVVPAAASLVRTEQVRSVHGFSAGLLSWYEISLGQRLIWRQVIGLALAIAD
jgi:hypothetical protein